MPQVARIPVEPTPRPRRTLDERMFLRAPWMLRAIYRMLAPLGPGSRLRRTVLVQSQLAGWEAQNREDWDVNMIAFHPSYEFIFGGGASPNMAIDIGVHHVGREGVLDMMRTWRDGFAELRFVPKEVLDVGGARFGVHVVQIGRGRTVPIESEQELWSVYWLREGLIERQAIYWEEDPALTALVTGEP